MALGWFNKKEGTASPSSKKAKAMAGTVPGSSKNATLGNLLAEDLILTAPNGFGKDKLIEYLVVEICARRGLGDPKPFLAKVLEREKGISTTLDTGLAVPHARMDGLERITGILVLIPNGMSDPKQPDLTIRVMFLFFSPNRQEAFTQHLHLLREVSALFQPTFIDKLLKSSAPSDILNLIALKESGD